MSRMVVGKLVMQAMIDAGRAHQGAQQVKAELRGLRANVTSTGTAFRNLGTALPVAAIVAGFGQMIRANEGFKASLQSSFAIMGDLSPKIKRQMRQIAHDVAFETKYTQQQAAQSYYYLASAGLSPQHQMAAMPKTMEFAQAGQIDAARGTEMLLDSVAALGLKSKDSAQYMENVVRVSDAIMQATTKAQASADQFGEALMNKGALGAKMMGYEVEEALAILMVFAEKGLAKGADAGQAMWMAMRDLRNKAIENEAAFKRLGVSVYDATGKIKHSWTIIKSLEDALDGLAPQAQTAKLLDLGFTQRSIAPLLSLIGESSKLLENYNIEMEAAGKTTQVAGDQMTPMNEGLHKMGAAIAELTDSGFGSWVDSLGEDFKRLATHIRAIGPALDELIPKDMRDKIATQTGWKRMTGSGIPGIGEMVAWALRNPIKNIVNSTHDLMQYNLSPPGTITTEMGKDYEKFLKRKAKESRPTPPQQILGLRHQPGNYFDNRTSLERLKAEMGPDSTKLQRDLAMLDVGVTDPRAKGLYEQWGAGKMTDQELGGQLQTLSAILDKEHAQRDFTKAQRESIRLEKQFQHELESRVKQQQEAARGVLESVLSPWEQFKKTEADLNGLRDVGALPEWAHARAMEGASEGMRQEYIAKARMQVPEYTPVAAKTMGSREAYSSIARELSGGSRPNQVLEVANKQLEEDKKVAENTGSIKDLMKEHQVEVMNFGGG